MDLFHKLIELIDKNSSTIPEGDYIELCDTMKQLRDKVKPPSFLDQSIPMWMFDETNQRSPVYEPTNTHRSHDSFNWGSPVYEPTHELPSDPVTTAQRDREQDGDPSDYADSLIGHRPYPETATQREQEQLHQHWRERSGDEEVMYPGLNNYLQELDEEWTEHVEPGAYYPPQTETTSTVEVSLSE